MDERNNLGRQYTSEPRFGSTYPNTQYKGYKDHEGAPFGAASGEHQVAPMNQYGHTSQYQGNNPDHSEDRFSNVRAHGGQYSANTTTFTPSATMSGNLQGSAMGGNTYGATQYQGMNATSQVQSTGRARRPEGVSDPNYGNPQTRGTGSYGYGGSNYTSPMQGMGATPYGSYQPQEQGGSTYGSQQPQGMSASGYGSQLSQGIGTSGYGSQLSQGIGTSGYGSQQSQGIGTSGYGSQQPQGMSASAYGSQQPQGMGASAYGSQQPQGMGAFAYGSQQPQGMGAQTSLAQGSAAGAPVVFDNLGTGSSFRNETLTETTATGMATGATPTTTPLDTIQGQSGTQFNDRDRLQDLLSSEKHLTEGYNLSTFEATNPELYDTLRSILNTTHENRDTLHQTMEQKGWYRTELADQQTVAQAYTQFTTQRHQLPF